MTYLDYNATTPLCQEAWEAMLPWLQPDQSGYGNPSSIHALGRRARAAIDDARDKWASWLQVKSHELIFTGGGTESDNLAIIGLARRHRENLSSKSTDAANNGVAPVLASSSINDTLSRCAPSAPCSSSASATFKRGSERGHHLITAATEHHAVLHAMKFLQEHEGFEVTYLPVDHDGLVHPERLREVLDLLDNSTADVYCGVAPVLAPSSIKDTLSRCAPEAPGTASPAASSARGLLRSKTILVSIMQANNETGTIQPISELASLCRERNIYFHTDAIQSFGKIPSLPQELGVDAWSIAAHKFYGPKGVGLLWLRSGTSICSIQHGGAQEGERRPGTEDVASIVGMTAAAEVALRAVAEGVEAPRQRALREELWKGVTALYPRAKRHGSPETTLFNTLNVSFPGCDGETLLMALDLEGICLSSGSACMVGSIQASHVLQAMGVSEEEAHTAVRFSLGRGTTQEAIAKTLVALEKVIKRQKKK